MCLQINKTYFSKTRGRLFSSAISATDMCGKRTHTLFVPAMEKAKV